MPGDLAVCAVAEHGVVLRKLALETDEGDAEFDPFHAFTDWSSAEDEDALADFRPPERVMSSARRFRCPTGLRTSADRRSWSMGATRTRRTPCSGSR